MDELQKSVDERLKTNVQHIGINCCLPALLSEIIALVRLDYCLLEDK